MQRAEVAPKCGSTKSAARKALTALTRWCAVALLAAFPAISSARADAGVILNESLDTSVARITGSGHSAIYVSRICPESPVKLRLCAPGEQGSVISNYTTLGEDQPYEWNIVPLSVFLYGVEDPANRPLVGSPKIKRLLEERYRDHAGYVAAVTAAADRLVRQRFLLPDDAARLVREAEAGDVLREGGKK